MKIKVIVLAGGRGQRFWPKSRKKTPKQFIAIGGRKTLIRETVDRLLKIIPIEDIYISSGEDYSGLLKKQLPEIPKQNLILEPEGRDTAASILLSLMSIPEEKETLLFFVPADHHITKEQNFKRDVKAAVSFMAQQDKNKGMLLLGIPPSSPSESFGYIEIEPSNQKVKRIKAFIEKPPKSEAEKYIRSKAFFWNGGMFLFEKTFMLGEFKKHAPDLYKKLQRYMDLKKKDKSKSQQVFHSIEKISFDYAIVEKLDKLYCLGASFEWDDVGSWEALKRIRKLDKNNNVVEGNADVFEVSDSICINQNKKQHIVLSGVKGLTIINSEDVLYITSIDNENNIKKILPLIEKKNRKLI